MGIVFGKINVETPKYEVIAAAADYEIRKYPPAVVAEVTYDPADFNSDKDGGFSILGRYIGAFGKAENARPEPIAMTAPVLTAGAPAEKVAMTAPVLTSAVPAEKVAMTAPVLTTAAPAENVAMTAPVVTKSRGEMVTMAFILPSKYARAADAPKPLDDRVVIREEEPKKYAVVKFSGVARESVVAERVKNLKACLERDGYQVTGDFVLARYNPPFTLPALRTNEVMLPVE